MRTKFTTTFWGFLLPFFLLGQTNSWEFTGGAPARISSTCQLNDTLFADDPFNLLYSTDQGQNWKTSLSQAGFPFLDPMDFQSYNNPNTVFSRSYLFEKVSFFLTEETQSFGQGYIQNLYRSDDRGKSGEVVWSTGGNPGLSEGRLSDIRQLNEDVFLLREDAVVSFIGQDVRYYVSKDKGQNWQLTNKILDEETVVGEKANYLWTVNEYFLYARKIPQLYTALFFPIPTPKLDEFQLHQHFFYNNILFIIYYNPFTQEGVILRSNDFGVNWQEYTLDLSFIGFTDFSFRVFEDRFFLISNNSFGGNGRLFYSSGLAPTNFQEIDLSPYTHPTPILSLDQTENEGPLVLGLGNGSSLQSLDAGDNWAPFPIGLGYYYNMEAWNGKGVLRNNRGIYVQDETDQWKLFHPDADPGFRPAQVSGRAFQNDHYYYARGNSVFRNDKLSSVGWSSAISGLPGSNYRLSASKNQLLAHNGQNLFISEDDGLSWLNVNLLSLPGWTFGSSLQSIQAFGTDSLLVNIAQPWGMVESFRSSSGGDNWSFLPPPLPSGSLEVRFDPQNGKYFSLSLESAGTNQWEITLYESLDGGQNWSTFTTPLPFSSVSNTFPLYYFDGILFSGNRDDNQLFYSQDKGASWESIDLPVHYFHDLTVSRDRTLWVSSQAEGAWKIALDELGIFGDAPDLALEITVDSIYLDQFQNRIFTISLHNQGSLPAEDVFVEIPIPQGLAYVSHVAGQGNFIPFTGIWEAGDLPGNTSLTLEYTLYVLEETAPITLYAQVSAAGTADPDSSPGNGQCCDPLEDDEAAFTLLVPPVGLGKTDLELSLTVDDSGLIPGEIRTFYLNLSNLGLEPASNLSVEVLLPGGLTYLAHTADAGSFDPVSGLWQLSALGAGESLNLEWTMEVEEAGFPLSVYAQVTAAQGPDDLDSTPGNGSCCSALEDDEASVVLDAQFNDSAGADLEITIDVDSLNYNIFEERTVRIELYNRGDQAATDIVVAYPLPAVLSFVGHTASQGNLNLQTQDWNVGNLSAGAAAWLEYTVFTLVEDQVIALFTQVLEAQSADADSSPGNGICCIAVEDDEAVVRLGDPGPSPGIDLSLDLIVDNEELGLFQERIFELIVTNDGPGTALDVEVSFPVPSGMAYVSHEANKGNFEPFSGNWSVGSLGPMTSAKLSLTLFILEETPITAYSQVINSFPTDSDSTPGNGSCCIAFEDDEAALSLSPPPFGPQGADRSLDRRAIKAKEDFTLFPNPAQDEVQIVIEGISPVQQLFIFDAQGRQLLQRKEAFEKNISLNIEGLPPGTYFVRLGTLTKALIKQ